MSDSFELAERGVPFVPTLNPVDETTGTGGMGFSVGNLITVPGKSGLPSWWSPARDLFLSNIVTDSDPLKIAISTFTNKLVSVPFLIEPRDTTVVRHAETAAKLQWNLENLSGFMRGFREELKRIVRDYLESDNGCFAFIMGNGSANKPILGPALGILHLDSFRCTRTGDPEFPVIYSHTDGKRYALHYTRVIAMSNLPSPRAEMFGVGLSAVSCAIEAALELRDIATYSAEKMGSRPPRQILYARRGATISELSSAVAVFDQKMASEGMSRFAKTLLLAPKSANMELNLDKIDLASVPDGFDREKVSVLDLSILAAAFGLDLHDLSIAMTGRATAGGTAEIQSKKGRGKGVHEFIETFTDQFQRRFLPEYLTFRFDEVDDDADEQRSDIQFKRAQSREKNLSGGVTTLRVERTNMLRDGEITPEDFAMLELADGRTPDGLDILFLFYSTDPAIEALLGGFDVPDPTDIIANDASTVVPEIRKRQIDAYLTIESARNAVAAGKARMALYALQKLETLYLEAPPPEMNTNDQVALEAMDESAQLDEAVAEETDDETVDTEVVVEEKAAAIEKQLPFGLTDLTEQEAREISSATEQYGDDFEALVEDAAAGRISQDEFVREITELATAILLLLFMRGIRQTSTTLTLDEVAQIEALLGIARESAADFGADLYREATLTGSTMSLAQAIARVGIWVNMAIAAYSIGQTLRRDNPKLKWNRTPWKDSCPDCLRLNGQVHTGQAWRASGWTPRAAHLSCKGYNCGCYFTETTDPERGSF